MSTTGKAHQVKRLRIIFAPEVSPEDRKALADGEGDLIPYGFKGDLLASRRTQDGREVAAVRRRIRARKAGEGLKFLVFAVVAYEIVPARDVALVPPVVRIALFATCMYCLFRGVTSLVIAPSRARRRTAGRARSVELASSLHRRYLRPDSDLNKREQGLLEQAVAAYNTVAGTRIYKDGRVDTSVNGLALDAWIWDLAEALARTTALARAAELGSPSTGPKADARRTEVLDEIDRELGKRAELIEQFENLTRTVVAQDGAYRDEVESEALAAATDAALTDLRANSARLPYARKEIERMAEDLSLTDEAEQARQPAAAATSPRTGRRSPASRSPRRSKTSVSDYEDMTAAELADELEDLVSETTAYTDPTDPIARLDDACHRLASGFGSHSEVTAAADLFKRTRLRYRKVLADGETGAGRIWEQLEAVAADLAVVLRPLGSYRGARCGACGSPIRPDGTCKYPELHNTDDEDHPTPIDPGR